MHLLMALLALVFQWPGVLAAAECDALEGETIRWLVPSKAGGGYDAYSRLLQPFLERSLQARIVIENRPEAGGVVAAVMIRDAEPDGRTLGIINAAGLLAAHVSLASKAPDPSRDFSVLARVVANHMMLFTGPDSGISNIDDLLRVSATRPVVVGVRDAGSSGFFAFPIAAHYLGLDYSLVTGYVGSTSRVLASLRGEVDIILQTFDSVLLYVKSGELVPLLWLTAPASESQMRELAFKVPVLGELDANHHPDSGEVSVGEDPVGAGRLEPDATAISSILSAGRVVLAPKGLAPAIQACLQDVLAEVLGSPGLKQAAAAASLTLEPAGADQALQELRASRQYMEQYAPLVRAAIDQSRQ